MLERLYPQNKNEPKTLEDDFTEDKVGIRTILKDTRDDIR